MNCSIKNISKKKSFIGFGSNTQDNRLKFDTKLLFALHGYKE
ncbi:hypothetical protein DES37_112151 [Mangrovibacter plantisponsor]|uniref:Uncharacterized protein n=1 Tax=Mangrovibacter plantisponsor TaxID=451513 RepID=A0A317Q020_9ENTR|nr:hypothetical protein DES37_112151 [Mangrovibacter plantisponsor]